jgi:5-methylcytosine-specific restriction endonuclease McrA
VGFNAEREAALLNERAIVQRWRRYALVEALEAGDEELWSLREGALWYLVAARLAQALRREFSGRHARHEARLWSALLDAAERCGAGPDGTDTDVNPYDDTAQSEASQARWVLSRALRAYSRAGTPPRTAIPARVGRSLMSRWDAGGRRCGICGAVIADEEAVALDHLLPVSRGGGDAPENLRVAHARCNARRGAWVWDGDAEALRTIRLRLEPAHPSRCAAFACWFCGEPTRGYVDVDGLPTLRFCPAHRGWENVRALLAGHGVPAALLDRAAFVAATD